MVTILLIILFLGTSTKAFKKGVEAWNKETLEKKEANRQSKLNGRGDEEIEYTALPSRPSYSTQKENGLILEPEVPILKNVYWKQLGLLVLVWITFLILQIIKDYTITCSVWYWIVNLLQIPVSVGVTLYEAINLYNGKRVIASNGDECKPWKIQQLFLYSLCGVLGGMVGGLLGLGGGFILGPLFLELGIPPQVSGATATFAMTFSSSMSVVEYHLLHRFPVPYGSWDISFTKQ